MRFRDQLNREIELPAKTQRIISLVPSITELLIDLGLSGRLVGRTRFCIHPKGEIESIESIGGTKTVSLEKVKALRPDFIVANKEENEREQVEALARDYPVYISDVDDLPSGLEMIRDLGEITGQKVKGEEIASQLESSFLALRADGDKKRVAYLIWRKPYMTVGGDTFIHNLLDRAGYENVFADHKRYPQVRLEDIREADPDLVFLSSEPYRFTEKHYSEFEKAIPNALPLIVDGELFSWYGSRLLHSAEYFKELKDLIESKL